MEEAGIAAVAVELMIHTWRQSAYRAADALNYLSVIALLQNSLRQTRNCVWITQTTRINLVSAAEQNLTTDYWFLQGLSTQLLQMPTSNNMIICVATRTDDLTRCVQVDSTNL